MPNHNDNPNDERAVLRDPELNLEVLLGRLVDGEATLGDRRRFEDLAEADPEMWKRVALYQHDLASLTNSVHEATARAMEMDLPRSRIVPRSLTWPLALSGWAALLIVGLTWAVLTVGRPEVPPTRVDEAALPAPMSPEDHFRAYLGAPYVLGDMQPVVLEVDELADGRIALYLIRRTEEVLFIDPDDDLPVDKMGELIKDLSALRRDADAIPTGSD